MFPVQCSRWNERCRRRLLLPACVCTPCAAAAAAAAAVWYCCGGAPSSSRVASFSAALGPFVRRLSPVHSVSRSVTPLSLATLRRARFHRYRRRHYY